MRSFVFWCVYFFFSFLFAVRACSAEVANYKQMPTTTRTVCRVFRFWGFQFFQVSGFSALSGFEVFRGKESASIWIQQQIIQKQSLTHDSNRIIVCLRAKDRFFVNLFMVRTCSVNFFWPGSVIVFNLRSLLSFLLRLLRWFQKAL